uniref:Uncharacterized protein n=1 Tax=Mycena chlorophos TaxID=658473 RepID=A0ABQ0KV23_MYCCL|nr:predicted protein [Mycena chlorophos]
MSWQRRRCTLGVERAIVGLHKFQSHLHLAELGQLTLDRGPAGQIRRIKPDIPVADNQGKEHQGRCGAEWRGRDEQEGWQESLRGSWRTRLGCGWEATMAPWLISSLRQTPLPTRFRRVSSSARRVPSHAYMKHLVLAREPDACFTANRSSRPLLRYRQPNAKSVSSPFPIHPIQSRPRIMSLLHLHGVTRI